MIYTENNCLIYLEVSYKLLLAILSLYFSVNIYIARISFSPGNYLKNIKKIERIIVDFDLLSLYFYLVATSLLQILFEGGNMERINFMHLEAILRERGMTKQDLSDLTNYSPTTVYRVFSQVQNPSLKFVYCIVDKLELNDDDIIRVFFPEYD